MKRIKTLWELFLIFFKIGAFTFGGGLAMLPLIQKAVVDDKRWIDEEEILDVFAISQSLPGVIAINSAAFVGNRVAGFLGAVIATLAVVLPAFLSILLVIGVLAGLKDNVYVSKVFAGIRAASAALILLAALKLGKAAINGKMGYVIALVSFAAIIIFDIYAAWVIVFGGFVGYISYVFAKRSK